MRIPNVPIRTSPAIVRMGGMPKLASSWGGASVGWTIGGAAVKVGSRVAVMSDRLNCAASVGSMVGDTRGVAVGGGSMIGKKLPGGSRTTNGEYTHATLLGTPT